MKKIVQQSNSGFTLIETLVAVTILIIGVIGPLSLAARGISDGLFAQNQLTANLLAQEAMEVIINKRNSNVVNILNINPADGLFGDFFPANMPNGFEVKTIGVDAMMGGIDDSCQYDDDNGQTQFGCYLNNEGRGYYEKSNSGGQFIRQITVKKISNDEIGVTVTIKWKNKNTLKTFTLSEYLYGK